MASQPALWPDSNTAKLIDLVHQERHQFSNENALKACEKIASLLPFDPRTGQRYSPSEVRKKLAYLKNPKGESKFSWDDIAREGRRCLTWKPTKGPQIINSPGIEVGDSIVLNDIVGETTQLIDKTSGQFNRPTPASQGIRSRGNRPITNDPEAKEKVRTEALLEGQQVQAALAKIFGDCDWRYVRLPASSHTILDTDIMKMMSRILSKMNIAVASISDAVDFNNLACPQWDAIQVRYPETSALLHDILGLSEKGSLSHSLAMLGLGELSFTDIIKALIGRAIHNWVFQSSFPTSLTSPDKSVAILERILDGKGLEQLKTNILADLRYQCLQEQRKSFSTEATRLAIKLGSVLQPMFMRHDVDDLHIGGPNIGKAGHTWELWLGKFQDLFVECLDFKALLKLDGDFFEFRWPTAGADFVNESMECIDPREKFEGRKVFIALLPAIIAPDRREVLFKSIVVLQ